MNRFDRILWRINGVVFLGLLLLGVAPLFWNMVHPFGSGGLLANNAQIVNEASNTHEKEFLSLGWPARVNGTNLVRIPLSGQRATSNSSFSSGGGYSDQTRNLLYLDQSDLSAWWLFEGFQRAIAKDHDLRAELEGKDKRVVGTIFEVATADTNGDQHVTREDRISAFFTSADGKKPLEIVASADRILSVDQISDTEVLITYQHGSAATAAVFSVRDGAKIREAPLPIKGNK